MNLQNIYKEYSTARIKIRVSAFDPHLQTFNLNIYRACAVCTDTNFIPTGSFSTFL